MLANYIIWATRPKGKYRDVSFFGDFGFQGLEKEEPCKTTTHMIQKLQQIMIEAAVNSFKKNGYAVLENFMSEKSCLRAVKQIDKLIQSYEPTPEQSSVFTTKNQNNRNQDYFLQSSDKVRFFFEEHAYKDGKLTVPKLHSINKIGHALHENNSVFKRITFQKQIGDICRLIPIQDPVVVQSMAILKPPKIGGLVNDHQDSTFLYDEPETLVGFWIPLQDATMSNGCLWGIPGSHKHPLYTRSRMNWSKKESYTQKIHEKDYKQSDFVPLEMKKGSLAFFSGRFVHKSLQNKSGVSRYAYTWHLKAKNTKWADDNWLQRQKFPYFEFTENVSEI